MRLRVVDIETTGTAPPAEIIEFGFSDVVLNPNGVTISEPISWLYRPLGEIPPETKAVHHLTEEDFPADIAPATPGHMRAAITFGTPPHVLVAHNCVFERLFLPDAVTGGLPWICTYKVALHVWPSAPKHSNQVLRYWRALDLARLIHEPSCQGVADPALRFGDGHGTQFLVARGTARFRVFAELRGWA